MDILTDELHKGARRNFPRRRVKVLGLSDLWQADLVEMQPYSRINRGYRYMLTCIDVMSKFAWAIPVRSKTGKDVPKGFAQILKTGVVPPKHLQVDKGGTTPVFSICVKPFVTSLPVLLLTGMAQANLDITSMQVNMYL